MLTSPQAHRNFSFDGQRLGMRTTMAILNHEQNIAKNMQFFANAATAVNDGYDYVMTASSRLDILDKDGNFSRDLNNEPFKLTGKYVQFGIKGKAVTGAVNHDWTVAWDKTWYNDFWGATKLSNTSGKEPAKEKITGNIYDGTWKLTGRPITQAAKVPNSRSQYTGIQAIDTISFNNMELMLGYQYQEASVYSVSGNKSVVSHGSSPLVGIVYHPNDNISVYASHSESFEKGTVVNSNYKNKGEILPPAKMKSNEVGIKFAKDGLLTSVALFDMRRSSTIEVGSVGTDRVLTMNGESRYRGLEVSVNGRVNDKLTVMGGLMYLDATYNKSNNPELQDKRVKGVADWSGVLGVSYKPTEKWELMGRIVYVGEAPIYLKNKKVLMTPSNILFDLGARYHTTIGNTPVTFNAMIYNLFDKNYWQARPGYDYIILGNPRTVSLSATMTW